MKYTAEAFDEWWFTTQFDRVYWQVNSQKHQTEYKWAKLAWDAARRDLLAEVERLKEQIFFKCASPVGLCPYVEDTQVVIKQLQTENERLSALAAQHLADQDYLCAKERKGVARECAEMCEPWGVADRIRTLGEFTGCKDRFDDEIYEGDILQQNVNSQAMPVIWENGKYIVRGTHDGDLGFYAGSCSVIGNIYANPELLTK